MRLSLLFAALTIIGSIAVAAAQAQNTPPQRIRGVIEAFSGQTLVVKARNGESMTLAMAPDTRIGTVLKASLSDIKPGDFVGSAAVKGADGKLKALEVHIFPESMRGTGEGQHPWDQGPDSSMTNATVGTVSAVAGGGTTLVLHYKDRDKEGEATIEVSPNVPIVTLAPGNVSMLQPGRAVTLFAVPGADGKKTIRAVTVESNSVKPPM